MAERFLVVDRDDSYRAWLQHRLGASWPEAQVQLADPADFERLCDSAVLRDVDLVLLGASFGADPDAADSEGLEWLRRLRERPELPPIVALADDGNELTAVRALRLGAADYLPKNLLTPSRLVVAMRLALRAEARRRAAHEERLAAAPVVQPRADAACAEAAFAEAASDDDAPDEPPVIPRYTILEQLGESDKAVVYLAHSEALDREVALKVSRRRHGEDAQSRQLFAREYAAIAALDHPSIVDIYDYGTCDGHEYLAMEYFPCGDLKTRLQQEISPAECLAYLRRIAEALCIVHAAGLVHRDLKPPNVMLRENGDIVLIDFGLARSLDQTDGSTRVGTLRGSPYYMSPEQAEGRVLDRRTDLYSLGVMLHEMLTGRKPYTGTSALEVLRQHVQAPVPRLPESLAAHQPLLDRLMAKDREQRIGSAEALLAELSPQPAAGSATAAAALMCSAQT